MACGLGDADDDDIDDPQQYSKARKHSSVRNGILFRIIFNQDAKLVYKNCSNL